MPSGRLPDRVPFYDDHRDRMGLERRLLNWLRVAAPVIVVIAFLAVSSRGLLREPSLAFGDLAAYPRNPSVFWSSFNDAWSDRGLGGPGSAPPAYLLSAGLIASTADNSALAQKLYFLGL